MVPWPPHHFIPFSSPWWCMPGLHTATFFFLQRCTQTHLSSKLIISNKLIFPSQWTDQVNTPIVWATFQGLCADRLKSVSTWLYINKYCKAETFVCLVLLCFLGFKVMLVNPCLHPCKGGRTILYQPGQDLDMWKCQWIAAVAHSLLPNDSARRATARRVGVQFLCFAICGDDMAVIRWTFKCLNFHFSIKGERWQQKGWEIGEPFGNFSKKKFYLKKYLLIL